MGLLLNENEFTSKSTSPKLIGETFTTLRTGIIDGAVEQDGSQYNVSDYPEIKVLLENNELPYVSIEDFDTIVTKQGGCNSFGYDSSKLNKWWYWDLGGEDNFYYGYSTTANVNNGDIFYIIDGWSSLTPTVYDTPESLLEKGFWKGYIISNQEILPEGTKDYGGDCSGKYGFLYKESIDSEKVYGAVANNPTDAPYYGRIPASEEYPNIGSSLSDSTYFKVPKKIDRVLVRSKKPSTTRYSWYNVYSDGWVEQGGMHETDTSSRNIHLSLSIKMNDTNYMKFKQLYGGVGSGNAFSWQIVSDMTSGQSDSKNYVTLYIPNNTVSLGVFWKVSGYADPTEYTKDKWDYQNIQVIRHMIQLK